MGHIRRLVQLISLWVTFRKKQKYQKALNVFLLVVCQRQSVSVFILLYTMMKEPWCMRCFPSHKSFPFPHPVTPTSRLSVVCITVGGAWSARRSSPDTGRPGPRDSRKHWSGMSGECDTRWRHGNGCHDSGCHDDLSKDWFVKYK